MKSVHTLAYYFYEIHLNVILPCTLITSSKSEEMWTQVAINFVWCLESRDQPMLPYKTIYRSIWMCTDLQSKCKIIAINFYKERGVMVHAFLTLALNGSLWSISTSGLITPWFKGALYLLCRRFGGSVGHDNRTCWRKQKVPHPPTGIEITAVYHVYLTLSTLSWLAEFIRAYIDIPVWQNWMHYAR
jgi:hypothetical protein